MSNNVIKNILTRRSIRKYQNKKISNNIIENILLAGLNAPSAGNQQPWQFIVVKDKSIFTKITKIHEHSSMLVDANIAIVVCGDTKREKHRGYWIQDCAAATQNILLAATSFCVGSVWLGVYPRKNRVLGIRKIFNLPKNIIPFSIISLGYPSEKKSINAKFDKMLIHYDKW